MIFRANENARRKQDNEVEVFCEFDFGVNISYCVGA